MFSRTDRPEKPKPNDRRRVPQRVKNLHVYAQRPAGWQSVFGYSLAVHIAQGRKAGVRSLGKLQLAAAKNERSAGEDRKHGAAFWDEPELKRRARHF